MYRSYLLTFVLDAQRFGLKLETVDRVVRAVAITPLPHAPANVSGVINFKGRLVPVLNIRRRLGLPEKELDVSDHLIVAHTAERTMAFIVDAVIGVSACEAEQFVSSQGIVPGLESVEGILKLPDGLVLVHDVNRFLSLEEAQSLDAALNCMFIDA